jgi:hypothetical protein
MYHEPDLSDTSRWEMLRRAVAIAVVTALGCGTSSHRPQLTAIAPATVSSLVATPGVVTGIDLDAVATVDLDQHGSASVDRAWSVRIDDVPADSTTWVDPQTLDITIPRGLAVGVHDVDAIAPDGRELVLPQALTVTGEPIGLQLAIEDAPGGAGQPLSGTFAAGAQVTAYAVVRDAQQTFVSDISVDWATTAPIGMLAASSG